MEMDLHTTTTLPKPVDKVEPRVKKCEEANNHKVIVLAGKISDGRWGEIPVCLAVLEAVSPVLKRMFSNQGKDLLLNPYKLKAYTLIKVDGNRTGMMSRAEFPQFQYEALLSFVMVSQFLYRRHEKEKGACRKYASLLCFTDHEFEGVADVAGFFQAAEVLHYFAVYTETHPSKAKVLAVERNLRYKQAVCVWTCFAFHL